MDQMAIFTNLSHKFIVGIMRIKQKSKKSSNIEFWSLSIVHSNK